MAEIHHKATRCARVTTCISSIPPEEPSMTFDDPRGSPPNAQVKRIYKVFGIKLPNQSLLKDFIAGGLP